MIAELGSACDAYVVMADLDDKAVETLQQVRAIARWCRPE